MEKMKTLQIQNAKVLCRYAPDKYGFTRFHLYAKIDGRSVKKLQKEKWNVQKVSNKWYLPIDTSKLVNVYIHIGDVIIHADMLDYNFIFQLLTKVDIIDVDVECKGYNHEIKDYGFTTARATMAAFRINEFVSAKSLFIKDNKF